jgi:hypothetical protein
MAQLHQSDSTMLTRKAPKPLEKSAQTRTFFLCFSLMKS